MPKIYPFDGKSAAVEALFGAAYSFDPNAPTKYTEALSYFVGTIIREMDVAPAAVFSKFPLLWPDQEALATDVAGEISDGIENAGLPAIITDMLPGVIAPLLEFGCQYLVGDQSPYKWIGETVLDNVLRFVLNVALEHYKEAFLDENPGAEIDVAGLEKKLDEIKKSIDASIAQESVVEVDGTRIWTKSLLFDEPGA